MDVVHVHHLKDQTLRVSFSDGTFGDVDLSGEIAKRPAFAPLQDPKVFRKAFVADGAVSWPGDLDIATERVYALAHNLKAPETFEEAEANELAVSLQQLRKLSEIRQEELATDLAITQGAVSRLEGKTEDAKLSTLRRYVQALGWDLEVCAVQGDKRLRLRGV